MAVAHLERAGVTVLDRNWRPTGVGLRGELDVVGVEAGVVVVVEVKTRRRATPAGPLEAITPRKLARLRSLAAAWRASHDVAARGVRIDAVGVWWSDGGGRATVEHLRGIG